MTNSPAASQPTGFAARHIGLTPADLAALRTEGAL